MFNIRHYNQHEHRNDIRSPDRPLLQHGPGADFNASFFRIGNSDMNAFKISFEGHVYNSKGVFAYAVERSIVVVAASADILDVQAAAEKSCDKSFGSFYLHTVEAAPTTFENFHYEAQPYDVADMVDVEWFPYDADDKYNSRGTNGYVVGNVVKGSTTSRLFHASSSKAWPTGSRRIDYVPISEIRIRDGKATYVSATCG